MLDLLQLFYRDKKAYAQLQQELPELSFIGSTETGSVTKFYGHRQHLFETLFETSFGIKLRGSLHKFAHGNNADTFKLTEIKRCIRNLMETYHIPGSAPIQRIELGVNLPFDYPEAVIDSAMLYNGRRGDRYTRKDYYAREWVFTSKWKDTKGKKRERIYYVVKLYKKAEHVVRYELHIEDIRKIAKTGIKVINDLLDDLKLLLALRYLFDSMSMLFFVPDDPKKKLPSPLHYIWGTYRADAFWREYDAREKKDTKCKLKKHITETIHTYDLIDWQTVIRDRFLVEGANIAEMSVRDFLSTFSQLGLQAETVAGPDRDRSRDRQSEIIMETIPAKRYLMARDIGYPIGVIILTLSYYPLVARGPPSLLSFFLLFIYAYSVALPIPVVESISLIAMVPASYRASACRMALSSAFGLPPFRPRARAAASPSIVRS